MQHLDLLRRVGAGELSPEAAASTLRAGDIAELAGLARLDLDRAERIGIPEIVLAGPKRTADVVALVEALLEQRGHAHVSRLRPRQRRALADLAARMGAGLVAHGRRAASLHLAEAPRPARAGLVGLLAAGTADLDVLAEAAMVCDAAGCATRIVADVGVAGLHRLFAPLSALVRDGADCLVVAAGMDGALPSVVAGLAGLPVIGLPTSNAYGHGGRGEGALTAMLQSCAPGLVVVNIDNGVGAGAAAALIARRAAARSDAATGPARAEHP